MEYKIIYIEWIIYNTYLYKSCYTHENENVNNTFYIEYFYEYNIYRYTNVYILTYICNIEQNTLQASPPI